MERQRENHFPEPESGNKLFLADLTHDEKLQVLENIDPDWNERMGFDEAWNFYDPCQKDIDMQVEDGYL